MARGAVAGRPSLVALGAARTTLPAQRQDLPNWEREVVDLVPAPPPFKAMASPAGRRQIPRVHAVRSAGRADWACPELGVPWRTHQSRHGGGAMGIMRRRKADQNLSRAVADNGRATDSVAEETKLDMPIWEDRAIAEAKRRWKHTTMLKSGCALRAHHNGYVKAARTDDAGQALMIWAKATSLLMGAGGEMHEVAVDVQLVEALPAAARSSRGGGPSPQYLLRSLERDIRATLESLTAPCLDFNLCLNGGRFRRTVPKARRRGW